MIISKEAIEEIAKGALGVSKKERTFKAHFVVSSKVVAKVWNKLERQRLKPDKARPLHLLWFLYWVKVYSSDDVGANFCQCKKRDTFAEWTLRIGIAVSNLRVVSHIKSCVCESCMQIVSYELFVHSLHVNLVGDFVKIRWSNRWTAPWPLPSHGILTSVNRTACPYKEERLPDGRLDEGLFCPKFKGPGLNYEVVLGLYTGLPCSVKGPYKFGDMPDLPTAENEGTVDQLLQSNERCIGDGTYRHPVFLNASQGY